MIAPSVLDIYREKKDALRAVARQWVYECWDALPKMERPAAELAEKIKFEDYIPTEEEVENVINDLHGKIRHEYMVHQFFVQARMLR